MAPRGAIHRQVVSAAATKLAARHDGLMHVTLELPGLGERDCWAEDGATLGSVLADLGLAGAADWSQPLDQPLTPGALVQMTRNGGGEIPDPPTTAGHATTAGRPRTGVWLGAGGRGDAPGPRFAGVSQDDDAIAPGGWRLVCLVGPEAGRRAPLRAADAPVAAGATKRGRVRLAERPGVGPAWLGRVRRRRAGRPKTAWRRLGRGRRAAASNL
ncbi:MAG: hypothetical protein LBO20_08895, partial [Bifidobacteriaceae bacterium]|nr:hypothetical protein [Bifidobacteriaceae bacterium]